MQVVIFGLGVYYNLRKNNINQNTKIVAFIDNNSDLWGKTNEGISIFSPSSIIQIQYDKILLMSRKSNEMKKQLLEMGISRKKIMYYEEFLAEVKRGKLEIFYGKRSCSSNKKRILIIFPILGFHGVSMISLYTAKALQKKGYQVSFAVSDKDKKALSESINNDISVIVHGGLYYIKSYEMFWIREFDFVIINSYELINVAIEVNKIKPCIWWLHDPLFAYKGMFERYDYIENDDLKKINIFAVSDVAQKCFKKYYPDTKINLLKYGIEDKRITVEKNNRKLIFAIIGYVCEIKAQDVFMSAINKISKKKKKDIEFWIIGNIGNNAFQQEIKIAAESDSSIKILGDLDRNEMNKVYSKIDVIVNPSREDACPTVVVEGMMYGRVCITSDETGIAPFIKNGNNGFVCKAGDDEDLYEKINWILLHKNRLKDIGKMARITYETNFTLEKLRKSLEKIMENCTD